MTKPPKRPLSCPWPLPPNPAATRGWCVMPFGKAWALVYGLGVVYCSINKDDCERELEAQKARIAATLEVEKETAE